MGGGREAGLHTCVRFRRQEHPWGREWGDLVINNS